MSDEKMPEQPKTTQLPAADPVQVLLAELTREVRGARVDIGLVSNDLGIVKERVTLLETHRNDAEARAARASDRVREVSKIDLEQDAQLAQERTAREELAAKVDALTATQATQLAILGRLDKVTSNPTVKVLAGMIATALVTWLASHGGAVLP